jgi:hypothetical protein
VCGDVFALHIMILVICRSVILFVVDYVYFPWLCYWGILFYFPILLALSTCRSWCFRSWFYLSQGIWMSVAIKCHLPIHFHFVCSSLFCCCHIFNFFDYNLTF